MQFFFSIFCGFEENLVQIVYEQHNLTLIIFIFSFFSYVPLNIVLQNVEKCLISLSYSCCELFRIEVTISVS